MADSLNRYVVRKAPHDIAVGIWDQMVGDFLNSPLPFSDGESPVTFLSEEACERIVDELNALHDKIVD